MRKVYFVVVCLFFKLRKNEQKKLATCFATLRQNGLNNDAARFTTDVQTC